MLHDRPFARYGRSGSFFPVEGLLLGTQPWPLPRSMKKLKFGDRSNRPVAFIRLSGPQDHWLTFEYQAMNTSRLTLFAAVSLAIGGLLGLAGSFSPPAIRGVAWGLDGTALVMGALLLAVHHVKLGNEQLAAGFFTFVAGQTLVVSSSAMDLAASSPSFGAGVGLWAAGLALVSASPGMPIFVRATGAIASVLFAIVALQIFGGTALTPLSNPLPFNAYPFLVLTLFGWAWVHWRRARDGA